VDSTGLKSVHICVVAYFADPLHGSEPTNAWNWVDQLSRRLGRVTLVTSPRTGERLEELRRDGIQLRPNVECVPVTPTGWAMKPPVPAWYREYAGWLDEAAVAVADIRADISHHVTVGTPFWGSSLFRANGPTVLGPVGISHAPPVWTGPRWGVRDAASEAVRGVLGAAPGAWPRGLAGVRGADHILAADPKTATLASRLAKGWGKELLEGVDAVRPGESDRELTLVWAGKFIHRKAPELAIRAWRSAVNDLPSGSQLVMYGEGPLRPDMQALAGELGLTGRIELPGRVPQPTVVAALRSSRGLLFTSLRDTSSTQMLEACASGTPSVSLRHPGVNGLDLWYPQNAGWAAEAKSWRGAIRSLSSAIVACLNAPDNEWAIRSARCTEIADGQTWEVKANRMAQTYLSLMSRG
jgi:glycosyltransferase involved in cell wall biosynthesis